MSRIKVCSSLFLRYLHYPARRSYNCVRYKFLRSFEPSVMKFNLSSNQHYSRVSFTCWSCNSKYDSFSYFCPKCSKIQKPSDSLTYFDLFDLNESFDVNLSDLSKTFRAIQAKLHPDKFNLKGKEEQNLSSEYSSLVNKAYSSLTNPLSRAIYMLQLKGIAIEEDKTEMDKMFLMEIMELNEELENADSQKLMGEEEKNKIRLSELYSELSNAFKGDQFTKAKELVMRIKYFVSIENRINEMKLRAIDK